MPMLLTADIQMISFLIRLNWIRQNKLGMARAIAQGLFFCAACLYGGAARSDWPALEALQAQGVRVSALVRDLETGENLQSLNAGTRLSPASVSKILVASAALETWPADKTFETRVQAQGLVRDGRLNGNLMLSGDGDATLDHLDLWYLAGQIRAAGIRSVAGGVVARPAFGPFPCEEMDRCMAQTASKNSYDAPISSLGVDYGTWCIEFRPGQAGQPVQVSACGGFSLPLQVGGQILTGKAKAHSNFKVLRNTLNGRDAIEISGVLSPDQPVQVHRSMSDPALGSAQVLQSMLGTLGIRAGREASVIYTREALQGDVIARTRGLALREQIGRMMRYSNNYLTDLLTLNLAAARRAEPPQSLSQAAGVLSDHLLRRSATANQASPPKLLSGSGLTPENELSAAEVVTLLQSEFHRTQTFPVFYGAFVVPQQAPSAFLRGGSKAWMDRVALKSGTLTEPDPVRAVAGYIRKKNGGWMAFAVLVNGSSKDRRHNNPKAMIAIMADIDGLLARH